MPQTLAAARYVPFINPSAHERAEWARLAQPPARGMPSARPARNPADVRASAYPPVCLGRVRRRALCHLLCLWRGPDGGRARYRGGLSQWQRLQTT